MRLFERTIHSLVDENFIYARALHCLGIEFYLYPNKKLGEICAEKGLERDQIIQSFYLFNKSHQFSFRALQNYPLEVVIEYLKHTHHLFIKDKLPYIVKLLNNYEAENDVKLVFPEFVDEFIAHIYHEEDSIFQYIQHLLDFEKTKHLEIVIRHFKFNDISLTRIHAAHEHEDELEGIRNLIEDRDDPSIHWQVIASEIRAFDREMWYHAEIENKILFPKAILLEQKVNRIIKEISRLN